MGGTSSAHKLFRKLVTQDTSFAEDLRRNLVQETLRQIRAGRLNDRSFEELVLAAQAKHFQPDPPVTADHLARTIRECTDQRPKGL
jgi:hypothetical protein